MLARLAATLLALVVAASGPHPAAHPSRATGPRGPDAFQATSEDALTDSLVALERQSWVQTQTSQ